MVLMRFQKGRWRFSINGSTSPSAAGSPGFRQWDAEGNATAKRSRRGYSVRLPPEGGTPNAAPSAPPAVSFAISPCAAEKKLSPRLNQPGEVLFSSDLKGQADRSNIRNRNNYG